MDFHVEIEEQIEQPYVAFELVCSPDEFEVGIEQTLTEVWSLLEAAEVPPAGPPFCLVPQLQSADDDIPPEPPWRLLCGFPVEEDLEADEPVKLGRLPGGKVLTVVHEGRLSTLSTSYLALQVHMQANSLESNGSPWEVYLTDPVWEPDEPQWRTIVRWPVK